MALTRPTLAQLTTGIARISDPMTVLHQGATSANVDVGFLFNRANGLVSNVALYWSESTQSIVTAYTTSSGQTDSNVTVTSYAPLTVGNLLMVNGSIIGVVGNVTVDNLIANSGVYATSFNFANGLPFVSSTYSNANVTAYIPTDSTITAIQANVTAANAAIVTANSAVVSYVNSLNSSMVSNVTAANSAIVTANSDVVSYVNSLNSSMVSNVTAANAAIVTANSAVVSYVNSLNGAMVSNVNAANSAIVTANTAMKGYVDAVTTAWISNAATQQTQINTLQTQVYANANVSAYLPTYSGSIGTAVSTSGNLTVGGNLIVNGSTSTINNTVFETTEYVQTVDATTIRSVTLGNIGANIIGTGTYITGINASNLSSGTVPNARLSGAYTSVTGLGTLTGLSVTGDASVSGNLSVGNITISSGNITIANAGSFIGNAVTGYGALYAGIPSGYAILPSTPLQIATNDNTYSQLNMQNINNGSNASSDYVVTAGNGSDSTYYGDFGIASNTYSYPSLGLTAVGPNDTYLLGVGYNSLGPYTGNIGNVILSSSNGLIKLASGGANIANVVATVYGTGMSVNATTTSTSTTSGAFTVAGGVGIAGNVYSNAVYTNGLFWAGNNAVISTGGGGAGITYTASATVPSTPHVGDQWYNTANDVLYEYQNVGTGNFWIDITSGVITSGNVNVPGADTISPFLLMGA